MAGLGRIDTRTPRAWQRLTAWSSAAGPATSTTFTSSRLSHKWAGGLSRLSRTAWQNAGTARLVSDS